jgi:hypothetical protein
MTDTVPEPAEPDKDRALALIRVLRAKIAAAAEAKRVAERVSTSEEISTLMVTLELPEAGQEKD